MSYLADFLGAWNGDPFSQKVFWAIGLIGLALVCLQAVLTAVFGHGGDTDTSGMDLHDGHSAGAYLSLKSIAALMLGLGFGGAIFGQYGFSVIVAAMGGLVIGFLFATFFIALMRFFYRLGSDGTSRLWEAIGQRGKVYMRIPGGEAAAGEIQVSFGGRFVNIPAFTRGAEIPTGADVLVISVHGESALEVEIVSNDQLKIS